MAQGFDESRLPHFTEEEAQLIAGSTDFLGINFYTASLFWPEEGSIDDVSYFADQDVSSKQPDTWYPSASEWLKVAPWGLRPQLEWIKKEYGDIDIYITENGFSDRLGNLDDLHRIYYYKHYLNQLMVAITEDKANVKGYMAWSLLDNYEWNGGFYYKFGLHYVNFTDPERPRVVKNSAKYYSQIIKENGFVESSDPCTNVMQ